MNEWMNKCERMNELMKEYINDQMNEYTNHQKSWLSKECKIA